MGWREIHVLYDELKLGVSIHDKGLFTLIFFLLYSLSPLSLFTKALMFFFLLSFTAQFLATYFAPYFFSVCNLLTFIVPPFFFLLSVLITFFLLTSLIKLISSFKVELRFKYFLAELISFASGHLSCRAKSRIITFLSNWKSFFFNAIPGVNWDSLCWRLFISLDFPFFSLIDSSFEITYKNWLHWLHIWF